MTRIRKRPFWPSPPGWPGNGGKGWSQVGMGGGGGCQSGGQRQQCRSHQIELIPACCLLWGNCDGGLREGAVLPRC